MALLDAIAPRFAVPREAAPEAIRRMVRAFFAPAGWEAAWRQVEERFGRGELYGYAEGPPGRYGEQPPTIAWKPYETHRWILAVEVSDPQFRGHLVDVIALEHQVGLKVQPFPHGFQLERPMPLDRFEATLAGVLGHPVDLMADLRWRAASRFLLELFGGFVSGSEAAAYQAWLRAELPEAVQQRLRAAHRFLWTKRRAREIVEQMRPDRLGAVTAVAALLQEGAALPAAEAQRLAPVLLEHFPADLDFQEGVYTPLRVPIERDRLEVDYTCPFGVRGGLPHIPADVQVRSAQLILYPDTSQPVLEGIYAHQRLVLDAVDELRRSFGLPPDGRYEHYRSQALRD
ncbi:MAG: hypothetical protein ACOY93_09390 [Bacillota bacterium]